MITWKLRLAACYCYLAGRLVMFLFHESLQPLKLTRTLWCSSSRALQCRPNAWWNRNCSTWQITASFPDFHFNKSLPPRRLFCTVHFWLKKSPVDAAGWRRDRPQRWLSRHWSRILCHTLVDLSDRQAISMLRKATTTEMPKESTADTEAWIDLPVANVTANPFHMTNPMAFVAFKRFWLW